MAKQKPAPSTSEESVINLNDTSLYINRELGWADFNARVLDEALDERNPLLERVKFLAIFSNNLDEFFYDSGCWIKATDCGRRSGAVN